MTILPSFWEPFFFTCGSLSRPCHYMLLSRHFSLWLRRTIPLAVRCPLCRPLYLVSCIQIFSFSFLVCFCGTADAFLFSTFIRYFQVWSAVVDVVEPTSPVCSAYTSFLFFFPGALSLHETHYFSHSIWFHSL